jgi:hypothetical protein
MRKFIRFIRSLRNDPKLEIEMQALTSFFAIDVLLANPAAAAVYSDTLGEHPWTRKAQVEAMGGASWGGKDPSRICK